MLDALFDPNNPFVWILLILIIALTVAIIIRPFSTYIKFVYPNAKFEAIGNPYVTETELNKISENKTLEGFLNNLNVTKDYKISGSTIKEIQKSLDDIFLKSINMMKNDSSKKMSQFFNVYLEKLDSNLIKSLIENKLLNQKIDEKIIENAFNLKTKKILNEIISSEKKDLPSILKKYSFNDEIINLIKNDDVDFLKLDIAIDKHNITNFRNVKVPFKCDQAKNRFVNIFIDTNNIKYILRAKRLGYNSDSIKQFFLGNGQEIASWKYNELAQLESIPQVISNLEGTSYFDNLKNVIEIYHKEKSVQIFENALENNFLKMVKNISTQNYATIGPTIRFIVSKEYEIKNLKIIAKGIAENLSAEFIKPLLVKEVSL